MNGLSLASMAARRKFLLGLCLILCIAWSDNSFAAKVSGDGRVAARIRKGKYIYVEHRIRRGDSYIIICKRWTGSTKRWREIRKINGNKRLLVGEICRIPYWFLLDKYKLGAISSLFPKDSFKNGAWEHRVTFRGETVSSIASWFTGTGKNAQKVIEFNRLKGVLKRGGKLKIPSSLLLAAFIPERSSPVSRAKSDVAEPKPEAAKSKPKAAKSKPELAKSKPEVAKSSRPSGTKSSDASLALKYDSRGGYASYRLKKGEAIYTSVVVRFTGKISHDDVMDAVRTICERSGIRDVKNLPVGFEVKIPHELLLARYLPKEDKRRKEYEEKLKTVSKFRNVSRARDLDGVHVILDPGHGGRDPGAVGRWGMREDEYAYDIVCRIRRILLSETRAKVHITTRDRKTGYSVRNKKQLRPDANEVLLTTPKYANTNAKVSANLRCFLAASIYKSIPLSARNNNQVVFTSFHADSLYAALNGATIYVPDAYLSRRSLNRTGGIYDRTREVRACRPIKTTYSKRIRSEGYSRDFAKELIRGFKKHKVAVLSFNAIRDHVTRGRREYVPAVIRYNPVPTKLLLEVGNLQNRRDCRRLMNYTYREAIARAYVDALKRYYSRRNGQIAGSR
ncbi:N-acetylmuramoyl-L-alanine amidase [bacterium]|nr:N-acetylmuramoyl-L-alanine amidase [bacterium]